MTQSDDADQFDLIWAGLSFPTGIAFDESGATYVAESGLPFGGAPAGGRVLRMGPDGATTVVIDRLRPPVNGLTYFQGSFYVSEGGHPGRISRVTADGRRSTVVDDLPGPGNYHTNMAAFGPDDKLYFSQGAMTNSGIVGLDAYDLGWLRRLPHAHDLPGYDIVLAGINVETSNPINDNPDAVARTGAFVPFDTPTSPGQRVPARLPCTAAIMRCNPDGTELELVAWGLRNAYGLGFLPDGRLLAIDQGADDRGSRPIGNAPDLLHDVRMGAWYGWPDFIGSDPVTDPRYRPERGPQPTFILADHAGLPDPAQPLLAFPPHVAAVKFAVVPGDARDWPGQIIVALFGDEAPMTAPARPQVGRSVARIDPADWSLHALAAGPPARPIDVAIAATGTYLYILDFGQFEMSAANGVVARAGSGGLWRYRLGGERGGE